MEKDPLEKSLEPLLQVRDLTRRFGGLVAVKALSFSVGAGEVMGIIGPNGAGKTTVFSLLTGFLAPDSGSIRFAGEEVTGLTPHEICWKGMVRTFQSLKPFPRLTVLENAMVGALAHTSDMQLATRYAHEALDMVGLASNTKRLSTELPIGHLKMLEVAKALATRPRLLLLDEPYAGLNPSEGARFGDVVLHIRESGITICLIEHVMKAVMTLCDRIIVLHHGEKIAEGKPEAIAEDPAVVKAYLGGVYARG